jgi:hypothetical protein
MDTLIYHFVTALIPRSHTHSPDHQVNDQDQSDTQEALHLKRKDMESSEMRIEIEAEIGDLGLARPEIS